MSRTKETITQEYDELKEARQAAFEELCTPQNERDLFIAKDKAQYERDLKMAEIEETIDKVAKKTFTRRNFLIGAGAAAAGVALSQVARREVKQMPNISNNINATSKTGENRPSISNDVRIDRQLIPGEKIHLTKGAVITGDININGLHFYDDEPDSAEVTILEQDADVIAQWGAEVAEMDESERNTYITKRVEELKERGCLKGCKSVNVRRYKYPPVEKEVK